MTEVRPDVEVLLGLFNGELYLREFLDSLSMQSGVNVHLVVSDDGSVDNSIKIVEEYSHLFASVRFLKGPQNGPSKNYFFLLQNSTRDFVALADQDDIWLQNHLIDSIKRLSKTDAKPSLTFCPVFEFDTLTSRHLRKWPKRVNFNSRFFLFTENVVRGCTIVMNRKAVELANLTLNPAAVMHDWWLGTLLSLTGEISSGAYPEVLYRVHRNNYVGPNPRLIERYRRFKKFGSLSNDWPPLVQLRDIYLNYGQFISPERLPSLELFLKSLVAAFPIRRVKLILTSHRFRSTGFDEILIRLLIVSGEKSNVAALILLYRRFRRLAGKAKNLILNEIPIMINDVMKINIRKDHKTYKVISSSNINQSSKKLALIMAYPRMPLLNSTLRLLENLIRKNYKVVLVVNGFAPQDWIHRVSLLPISIISRENIGRDFGAFKLGFDYVSNVIGLENIDELLFANDSMLYLNSTDLFFDRFEEIDGPWVCAFLNFEMHTHAQSFLQKFDSDIFTNSDFIDFWKSYYPSGRRIHAINKGEVKLSQLLISNGYFPIALVNSKTIEAKTQVDGLWPEDKFALLRDEYYRICELPAKQQDEIILHRLRRAFIETNTTHSAGLLASRLLGAPLKLDILATGAVTDLAIRQLLEMDGLTTTEIDVLDLEFKKTRARILVN